VHAFCGEVFDDYPISRNIKCFTCLSNDTVSQNSTVIDRFEDAFKSVPAHKDVLTAQSAFHDDIVDEEKATEERISMAEPRHTAELTFRRRGPTEPVLNHGGTSRIERQHFGEHHLQRILDDRPRAVDNNNTAKNIEDDLFSSTSIHPSSRVVTSGDGKKKRKVLDNPVSVQEMRDGVVDKGVYGRYVGELVHFFTWLRDQKADWLTEFGETEWDKLATRRDKDTYRKRHARLKKGLYALLRNAVEQPIVDWTKMTPEGVMAFISRQANQFTGKALSVQGYGGKRSAIKHLVRCHNMRGHT
jgi:hypothetical protein